MSFLIKGLLGTESEQHTKINSENLWQLLS